MTGSLRTGIVHRYYHRTVRSRELWERAQHVFALGVSANLKDFAPYPVAPPRADDDRVWDADIDTITSAASGIAPVFADTAAAWA